MMLLPCIPELRVTDVTMPRPVLTFKDGQCIARFPAGLVVDLTYGPYQVRVSMAQMAHGLAGVRPVLMSCDDDLDAEYLPLQLSKYGGGNFGSIAAAPAGLLTIPVGSLIALTSQQTGDMLDLLDCTIAAMAREAYAGVAA